MAICLCPHIPTSFVYVNIADKHLGGKVHPITIANERFRFNSLYSKELDVIVILHNEAEVNARLINTTSRKLVYIICHGPEIRFALKTSTFHHYHRRQAWTRLNNHIRRLSSNYPRFRPRNCYVQCLLERAPSVDGRSRK